MARTRNTARFSTGSAAPKKHRSNAAAAEHSEPIRKHPKNKVEEIQPDLPPSSQPDAILSVETIPSSSPRQDQVSSTPTPDPAATGPIPDHATSLSNASLLTTSPVGHSIVHIDHRTGNVLGTYKSCYAAAKSVGISRHIVDSLVKGIYKANHHKGWRFRYATSEEEAQAVVTRSGSSDIEQIDVASGNVISTFRSIVAASKETGVGRKDITLILKGELESINGRTFRLVDAVSPDLVHSEPIDNSVEQIAPAHSNDLDLPDDNHAEDSGEDIVPADVEVDEINVTDHGSLDPPISENVLAETSEYKLLKIVISENGSIGIMARKTTAPEAISALRYGSVSGGPNRLRIDSFIGTNTIAEKSGMRIGDYLFLAHLNPVGQDLAFEHWLHKDFDDVAFCIRRHPRPTLFYVVRSKSHVIPSLSMNSQESLSLSDIEEELVEDMDPMIDLDISISDCTYHPIVITEPGPLGILAMNCEHLPEEYDCIPYFWQEQSDYARCGQGLDYDEVENGEGFFQVKSLIKKNCLAAKYGLQPGDYLMRPSSDHTPAAFNYQEAFFVLTSFEGICNAIKCKTRPLTLYAIRSKSQSTKNEISKRIQSTTEPTKATTDSSDDIANTGGSDESQSAAFATSKDISERFQGSATQESSDYEVLKIVVTEDGSMGIMARSTKAPDSVLSLVDLVDGCADEEMNLRIDSFIGTESIAEKFGMQVGDYLFLSYTCPLIGTQEEIIHGEYKSVSYCIRRNPRPTTFYVVRSKSMMSAVSSPSASNETLVEAMDPMKFLGIRTFHDYCYSYHPIIVTECGPLGMKTLKTDVDRYVYDHIPFFRFVDSTFNEFDAISLLKVTSRGEEDSLAHKLGIQAGDFLGLPCSNYTPAKFNYQEAFAVGNYDMVLDAIETGKRPLTLYVVRYKPRSDTSELIDLEHAGSMNDIRFHMERVTMFQ